MLHLKKSRHFFSKYPEARVHKNIPQPFSKLPKKSTALFVFLAWNLVF